jgi:hypothetical protein
MSDPSGSLTIALGRQDGSGSVSIGSTRPVSAARVFAGSTVRETARRLPLLFSVCATAQSAACAAACEQALGTHSNAAARQRRRMLLAAEMIREHLWRLLLDWPRALDRPPAAAAMAETMRAYQGLRGLLTARVDPFAPGAEAPPVDVRAATEAAAALTRCAVNAVFGTAIDRWRAQVIDQNRLAAWAAAAGTRAAALVALLLDQGLADLGRNRVEALPAETAAELGAALAGPGAAAFAATPTWQGAARETTPYARRLTEPLVADLAAQHGNGLLPRLAALLVELAHACAALQDRLEDGPATAQRVPATDDEAGIGCAEAARGLLVHRVEVANDRIVSYRILAPTEWNFHPAGIVAAGLAGIAETSGADNAELTRRARLHITAIDPCVAYRLSVS